MFKSPYKWLWLFGFLLFVVGASFWPYRVRFTGNDNLPTLNYGDVLFTNPWAKPIRGDLVLFRYENSAYTNVFSLVKRIVAVSGDKVGMVRGKTSVNGVPLDESEVWTYWKQHGGIDMGSWIANSKTWPFRKDNRSQEYTIPDGMVFVLGDNRSQGGSEDSRVFGPIKTSAIIAVVGPVIYPAWRTLPRPKGFEALNAQLANK